MKKERGRPRVDLEDMSFDGWELLDSLIVWASQEYCAERLGISIASLENKIREKHNCIFSEYKNKRMEPVRINLMKKQYDIAMNGNVTMLIWLGKQYCGQSEKVEEKTKGSSEIKIVYSKKDE